MLVEHADGSIRGGNARHTRNLRVMHVAPTEILTAIFFVPTLAAL